MYLERNIDKELLNWKKEAERKPMLVRGARQVGKSSSIRKLAENFDSFLLSSD
jgi:predicted AAA+ superfamily ATPase